LLSAIRTIRICSRFGPNTVRHRSHKATARRASEASHPARPTNVKKRPKGAFLLSAIWTIRTCGRFGPNAVRHRSHKATARRASEASHPARPTNVKKRPKGAFLLSAIWTIRTCSRFGPNTVRHRSRKATARRASEASHPARPTNAKRRPKGAFLLSAI